MKEILIDRIDHNESINVLFNLEGPYSTTADIIDTSKNNLPISLFGAITIGTDADGSYINIPSGNANYIQFGGTALDGPNTIIEFEMKSMTDTDNSLLFDTRPNSSNGDYCFLFYYGHRFGARVGDTSNNNYGVNNGVVTDATNHYQVRTKVRIEFLSDKTYFYENDIAIGSLTAVFNHINQKYKISYHSFSGISAPVRLYSFKVFKMV